MKIEQIIDLVIKTLDMTHDHHIREYLSLPYSIRDISDARSIIFKLSDIEEYDYREVSKVLGCMNALGKRSLNRFYAMNESDYFFKIKVNKCLKAYSDLEGISMTN